MGTNRPTVQSVRQRAAAVRSGQTYGSAKEIHRPATAQARQADIDTPTPPALPADMPPELLRGVTAKPVKVERGQSRIWTGQAFEVAECVTAVLFEKP